MVVDITTIVINFVDAGIVVLTAFISPFESEREKVKKLIGEESYFEVYVDCPIEVCEERDVKGLYRKARMGQIKNFTGIDSPFESPKNPTITVNTATDTLDSCLKKIISELTPRLKV